MPLSSVVFRCPGQFWRRLGVLRMEQYNQSLASAVLARLPACSLIWIWFTFLKMYSTGSSIVITLMSFRLISDNVA